MSGCVVQIAEHLAAAEGHVGERPVVSSNLVTRTGTCRVVPSSTVVSDPASQAGSPAGACMVVLVVVVVVARSCDAETVACPSQAAPKSRLTVIVSADVAFRSCG